MTTLFIELDSNDVANVKNQYETYGRQRAVQYVRQYCQNQSISRAKHILDTLIKENGWTSYSEDIRQVRKKRKFLERAMRHITDMGGKVEGIDTQKLRQQEIVHVKEFVRETITYTDLDTLSRIIKTFAKD